MAVTKMSKALGNLQLFSVRLAGRAFDLIAVPTVRRKF
jgi:hypothetical protein